METTTSSYQTTPHTQPGVWTLGAKSGLITGLILFIFTLIFQFILENFIAWWLFLIPVVGYIIGIVMTHSTYKREGDGFMSYGKGLGLATVLGAVSGLVLGILSFIYINVIDPTIIEKQADATLEFQLEMMESFGASDSDIDKALDMAEKQKVEAVASAKNPLFTIGAQVLAGLAFAFFISLVVSIFTRKNNPEHEF